MIQDKQFNLEQFMQNLAGENGNPICEEIYPAMRIVLRVLIENIEADGLYTLQEDIDAAKSHTLKMGTPGNLDELVLKEVIKALDIPVATYNQFGYSGGGQESVANFAIVYEGRHYFIVSKDDLDPNVPLPQPAADEEKKE